VDFDIAMLVLRVGIGTIFVAHGLQKLLGWWGGPGWEGWKGFIGYLGLKPPLFWASISLVAELGGGLALIAGLIVPLAAAGLVAQSITLLIKVHWPNGFWSPQGGIEFPLAFGAGAFAVQLLGPGAWSVDTFLPVDVLYEPAVRWVILGLAIAGALVAAFWPTPARPSEVAEGPSTTEAAPE
jgi:putative oxidoreductase